MYANTLKVKKFVENTEESSLSTLTHTEKEGVNKKKGIGKEKEP